MEKDTRNAIERATQRARKLLEEDFATQLDGDFDVHRDGAVAAEPGPHLTTRQAFQRERIVAAIEHKRAAGMSPADAARDYVRDASFTTLNRFVALKMLEARELVQECITKGEQSAGYREFCGMAPGLPLLPDGAGYRIYIESLFDELSTEVKVLFDRRDPSSVLWPKRATFEQLLEILNADELAGVWGEDETIGWVYQFFNGQDERRRMREESQAPRNSREMAVRNQFFTPRYVVQFLTDNTLGRIWYEMRDTHTALAERCEYMVRKPGEEFAPRPKKDPRDLRVLDPACGSGHFLLNAFDLLLAIYEEAHADPESPKSEATGRTLADDYPNLDALRKAIPRLILAHNLYGVDIDPRCAQIAQLALWMRAQKVYRDFGIARAERSQIRRSNIIVAEPLVADEQIAKEFVARLGNDELGRVLMALVDALKLAGELGLLLRVETLVAHLARRGHTGDLFAPAEERIRAALDRFAAESSSRTSTQRRLFADDAVQGMGLIAVAEKKFDVVLMNPPFGSASQGSKAYIDRTYEQWRHDVGPCFVARMNELLHPDGALGALTPRTYFSLTRLERWRDRFLLGESAVSVLADLGFKVLDGAMVEVAAYCCSRAAHAQLVAIDCLGASENLKDDTLHTAVATLRAGGAVSGTFVKDVLALRDIPQKRLVYWATDALVALFRKHESLDNGSSRVVREGLHTGDNERSLRLWWEVDPSSCGWRPFPKGGEYSTFYSDVDLVLDWRAEGRDVLAGKHGVVPSREFYFLPGITYTRRTASGISFRALPAGCIFSSTGPLVWSSTEDVTLALVSYLSSRPVRTLIEYLVGGGDSAVSRGAARDFMTGLVSAVPCPNWSEAMQKELAEVARRCWLNARKQYAYDETDAAYSPRWGRQATLEATAQMHVAEVIDAALDTLDATLVAEREICRALGLSDPDLLAMTEAVGEHPAALESRPITSQDVVALAVLGEDELVDRCAEFHKRRDATKQFHFAHRRLELVSRAFQTNPRVLMRAFAVPRPSDYTDIAWAYISWLLGRCFGRWREQDEACEDDGRLHPLIAVRRPAVQGIGGASRTDDILVDDEGHEADLCARFYEEAENSLGSSGVARLDEALRLCGQVDGGFRGLMRRNFFARHLLAYSKARRSAPIYWQLASLSARHSVWLYFHTLSKDSLFRIQNEFVAPKLAHEERRYEQMARELHEKGTAAQRRELSVQESFVEELRRLLEEVRRVAPLWNPNLDDGVIINFAPLWRLVPQHKAWQNDLKSTWSALCSGDYDWAHLAMHLYPERVVPKCAVDRSLAIAHGLERVFWIEGGDGKWTARKVSTRTVEGLVRERTSPAVKAALKNLLEAPTATGNGGRGRGAFRRSAAVAEGGQV